MGRPDYRPATRWSSRRAPQMTSFGHLVRSRQSLHEHHRRRSQGWRGWRPTLPTTCGSRRRTVTAQASGRSWGRARPTRRATAHPHSNEDAFISLELDVDENTPAGENVDSPVTATDQDTTTLTYEPRRVPTSRPVQLQHAVRSDPDEGAPESRGRAMRLR